MKKIILISILALTLSCSDDSSDCIIAATEKHLEHKAALDDDFNNRSKLEQEQFRASYEERLRQLETQKNIEIANCN